MADIENSKIENSLTDLVILSLSKSESLSNQAKEYLISLANKGDLEQHQTSGIIEQWTHELLKRVRRGSANET